MGSVGGLLGLSGGVSGTGQQITPGTNAGQLNTAYAGAQNSLQSQQALLNALSAQGGIQNQGQVYSQLQGVVNGVGPNPAQAQLAQATGANTANQAALMAGQRGASANPGLIARQAAMQGAANQQNSAGQAATLQANQSLGALGQAGALANQQVANQIGATTTNTQANQSEQGILQGANSQNNSVNGQLANTTMQGQQGLVGGALQGIGTAAAALAQGGMVQKLADGGPVANGPQSSAGQFLSGWTGGNQQAAAPVAATSEASPLSKGASSAVSGGIGAIAGAFSAGGNVGAKLKSGGGVPGQAVVSGNSPKNDTVSAKLSPGELVIDRETMADKGPAGQAARFLAAIIAKKKAAQ